MLDVRSAVEVGGREVAELKGKMAFPKIISCHCFGQDLHNTTK